MDNDVVTERAQSAELQIGTRNLRRGAELFEHGPGEYSMASTNLSKTANITQIYVIVEISLVLKAVAMINILCLKMHILSPLSYTSFCRSYLVNKIHSTKLASYRFLLVHSAQI
jgi:hypothetical protein